MPMKEVTQIKNHFEHIGVNQKHGGAHGKGVGNNESADGKFCGGDGSFHRPGLGDGGAGIG